MPTLQEAVGIASEPFADGEATRDFMYVDLCEEMSDEARAALQELMVELDVLQTNPDVYLFKDSVKEFPMPLRLGVKGNPVFPTAGNRIFPTLVMPRSLRDGRGQLSASLSIGTSCHGC
jgi:hypothetical protein